MYQNINEYIFRKEKIIKLCFNKTVLHLGFIQHAHLWKQKIEKNEWLHSKIAKVSKELIGIDYLKDEIKIIKKELGFDSYFANVMFLDKLHLDKKFDVIVCGELIEHIENPSLMLEGIKRFMHKDSILIITTPNPWSKARINMINENILEDQWLNPEHIAWYSFQTLKQLLQRLGFKKVIYDYYYAETRNDFKNIKIGILKRLIYKYFIEKQRKITYNYKSTETQKYMRKKTRGIVGFLRNIIYRNLIKKQNFDGLFFIVKLK